MTCDTVGPYRPNGGRTLRILIVYPAAILMLTAPEDVEDRMALLQILAGVFDAPADTAAKPIGLIAGTTGVVVVALGTACVIAARGIARLGVVAALRER